MTLPVDRSETTCANDTVSIAVAKRAPARPRVLAHGGGPVSRCERGALPWNASIVATDQGRHADALRLAERAAGLFAEDDAEVAPVASSGVGRDRPPLKSFFKM